MFEVLIAIVVAAAIALPMAYFNRDVHTTLDKKIEDKLKELPKFCENAKTIKIATDFDPRFFGKKEVVEAFKKAVEEGAEVKFITDVSRDELREAYGRLKGEGKIDFDFKEYEELEKGGKIKIKFVKKLNKHLWIFDDAIVRVESPHARFKFGKEGIGLIFKNFPKFGRACSAEFDEAWRATS